MNINFSNKPVIACVHLLPTPGTHLYDGDIDKIYMTAISDAKIFLKYKVDALIIENFRDRPFYPAEVPVETTAMIAGVAREIVNIADIPVGIAVLRNDAAAALAIATAVKANFIRINVHVGAVLAEQGIVYGNSHHTLRLRANLKSNVAIFSDVAVKHSNPFVYKNISQEVRDASDHSEAIIVSGEKTGIETDPQNLLDAKKATRKPVLIGSGVTPDNIHNVFEAADGFIVGSYFKKEGIGKALVEETRVKVFMEKIHSLRNSLVTTG